MSNEIKFEALLEGAAKLLEIIPEYKKKANKALKAADHMVNGKPVKKKFKLDSGEVHSLIALKELLNSIPDKSLSKMSMSALDNSVKNKIDSASYHYNKDQKEIIFFDSTVEK